MKILTLLSHINSQCSTDYVLISFPFLSENIKAAIAVQRSAEEMRTVSGTSGAQLTHKNPTTDIDSHIPLTAVKVNSTGRSPILFYQEDIDN